MKTTPTAALVEEAERKSELLCAAPSQCQALAAAIRRAEAERDEARRQRGLVRASLEALANGARVVPCSGACDESKPCLACRGMQNLCDWVKDCEQAEAERDAQQAEVLRLTGERDELLESVEELHALGFGLGCLLTNAEEDMRHGYRFLRSRVLSLETQAEILARQRDEFTATRDLLTEENARLQERVATLELLIRGGK